MAVSFPYRIATMWGLCALLGLAPTIVVAQPAGVAPTRPDTIRVQWEQELPGLTVTASRLPTASALAPARTTVLDSAALHRSHGTSVASVLDDRAGLHVRRYGEGGLATPALRSSGASQTTLLLDGQRISNPQIGHLDLSLLPTVLLRSIEIMHGPASSLHGSDGLGGAIHLRTLQPRSALQVRGTAHAGAFGERGGSLLVGGPAGEHTSALGAVDVQSTDGDFPYTDEARHPPRTLRRRNADRQRQSVYGSVRTHVNDHTIRISGWGTQAERGLPPTTSTGPAQERQWDTQLRLWAQDRLPLGAGHLTIQGLTQHTRLRYANPAQDIDQTGRTAVTSLETSFRSPLTAHWTGLAGATGSLARARHPELEAHAHQEHLAAFAEGTGAYGRLRLYPAIRADTYWMPDGRPRLAISPRFGVNVQPVPDWQSVHLKAQLGRAFRVPTFNDRYWQPGGNPDLRPERSWGGDVGLRFDHSRGHAEITAFGHLRRDQIVWQPTGNGYWAPKNVGRVRALGGEASATWRWHLPFESTLETGFFYTVTDARDRSEPGSASYDEPLRYVPRDQMKGHSTLTWGFAALTVHSRYTGRRYVTSDGSDFLSEYVVVNTQLGLTYELLGLETELSIEIDNLFDTNYQSMGGRPMPPRHARVRLIVSP